MDPLRSIFYRVSVTKLGRIWVFLDPFIPKSVELGDQVQTALVKEVGMETVMIFEVSVILC